MMWARGAKGPGLELRTGGAVFKVSARTLRRADSVTPGSAIPKGIHHGPTREGEFARGTLDQQSLRIGGPIDETLVAGWPLPEVLLAARRV